MAIHKSLRNEQMYIQLLEKTTEQKTEVNDELIRIRDLISQMEKI